MVLMSEHEVRKLAIKRFLEGESPQQIYRRLGRSKQWFFKWRRRYGSGENPDWFGDQPRVARQVNNKIHPELEEQIVEIRSQLSQAKYSQVGANAINWELGKRGRSPVPVSTINRVLKRQGLVGKKERRPSKNKTYPEYPRDDPNTLHQADWVGPRYIKNQGRFYRLNVMDVHTHRVKINPLRTKPDDPIAHALVESWRLLGVPEYLQMDNELTFRGRNRFPRSFGLVLRRCFDFRVVPVFIPIREPWRNGEIERFQGVFDKMFFRSQFFESFEALLREAQKFEPYHNQSHVYSRLQGRTPNVALGDHPLEQVPDGFTLPRPDQLKAEDGEIHLLRFIRSDRVLNVFGEKFLAPPELVYEYVVVVISTYGHVLHVFHDDKWVHSFDYSIPLSSGSTMG